MAILKKLLVVVCIVGTAAACGGGTKTGSNTTGGSSNSGGSTGGGQAAGTRFCDALRTSETQARAALRPDLDPASLRNNYQVWMTALRALPAIAPAAIKADLTLFVTTELKVNDALAKVNYDFAKLDQATIAQLTSKTFLDASNRLVAYSREVCGIPQSTASLSPPG